MQSIHDTGPSIPYPEYKAINEIVHAHAAEFGSKLRAIVAFGELLTTGDTYNIELLEIVEGWEGDRVAEFASSASLPSRGSIRMFFLTPSEFEQPAEIEDEKMRNWVQRVLDRVRGG